MDGCRLGGGAAARPALRGGTAGRGAGRRDLGRRDLGRYAGGPAGAGGGRVVRPRAHRRGRRAPGPRRTALHAGADRDPGPAPARDPGGHGEGRRRPAGGPRAAHPPRHGGRHSPGRAPARLHHGGLVHRCHRRSLADRGGPGRPPLPAAGRTRRAGGTRPGGGGIGEPSPALSRACHGISRRQRGGEAFWSRRARGGEPAGDRRRRRLPGRDQARDFPAPTPTRGCSRARRGSMRAMPCCSISSAAGFRRTPSGSPSAAAMRATGPGGTAATSCF